METITCSYLLALGILLIGLEAIIFSFILFFFGVGFIIVSGISCFYSFDNGLSQIAVAFVFALILAFLLRDYFLNKLSAPNDEVEQRTHISGFGYVAEDSIKFDGTYWKTLDNLEPYKDGDRVEIIDVVDNMVVLKK
ncbi:MAG: hypothetical protein U9P38_05825 [Campylobacterota bacterium]|nr:hypothetical protein [Campylobacterota bacterium]